LGPKGFVVVIEGISIWSKALFYYVKPGLDWFGSGPNPGHNPSHDWNHNSVGREKIQPSIVEVAIDPGIDNLDGFAYPNSKIGEPKLSYACTGYSNHTYDQQ
jgi:hypothetical protein